MIIERQTDLDIIRWRCSKLVMLFLDIDIRTGFSTYKEIKLLQSSCQHTYD